MDKIYFLRAIREIQELINTFEDGDLVLLTEIKRKISEINDILTAEKYNKSILKFINTVIEKYDDIVKSGNQKEALTKVNTFIDYLAQLKSKKIKSDEFEKLFIGIKDTFQINVKENKEIKKNKEKSEEKKDHDLSNEGDEEIIGEKKELYSDDYFSNITDDRGMITKYCDEAKEHLDNAQLSLIELEYDAGNQENINNVFRCFHTIKSSSAFLGIKNIEEVSHEVESLLVLVRDGNILITAELIDVIFFGINMIRSLVEIIEASNLDVPEMTKNFKATNIYNYINILKKILAGYKVKKIGEILSENGKIDGQIIDKILTRQENENKKFGEIALLENAVSEDDLKKALQKQAGQQRKVSFVKVSNERLNFLIDMVGELVVTQSIIKDNMRNLFSQNNSDERNINQLESITTSIKNIVLSMGMVPILEVFNKLKVVIRNASRELGKLVDAEIHGEDTELDRNVIELIYDPLVHIIRNALDHGIETSDERKSRGKSTLGKIRITAAHKGSFIEISVSDDGAGINKERVIKKAKKLNMLTDENAKSDKEIYSFLFEPGFSTAEKVTEISGRGVGLDVVKKNIEQINGKVEIHSKEGEYTRFIIKIPLTLAIIDGFVTVIDKKKYIFPFNLIEEIIAGGQNISVMNDKEIMLCVRDKYVPVIEAGKIFENDYKKNITDQVIILINHEGNSYGIGVDEVIGKQEIVIKNLNEALRGLKYFSGGTIFGDGSIGFVVNVEKFIECAKEISLENNFNVKGLL